MAQEALSHQSMRQLLAAVPNLLQLRKSKMWFDYDADADVLYLHFVEKPSSSHSELMPDGSTLDYRDDQLVGLAILEASHR